MQPKIAKPAMNLWNQLRNGFEMLMEEEDRIVLNRVLADCFCAYFTFGECGEF